MRHTSLLERGQTDIPGVLVPRNNLLHVNQRVVKVDLYKLWKRGLSHYVVFD